MIKPRTKTPELSFKLLVNETTETEGDQQWWHLSEQFPNHYTLIVFYRGYHCPICMKQLKSLHSKLNSFEQIGVQVAAVSCDVQEKAEQSMREWELESLTLGYDLPIHKAKEWGLFVSKGIKESEPEQFCEPGLFLVTPQSILYSCSIQSMPFARPDIDELISGLNFIIEKDYPARGEF